MATISTLDSALGWSPDVFKFAPDDIVPQALILQCSTVGGEIDGDAPSLHVAYVNDDDAEFVAEAAELHEGEPALAEVVVHTAKISLLVPLSNEQWNQDNTASLLNTSVARAITKRADQAFVQQVAPTTPAVAPPAGLLHVAGTVAGDPVVGSLDALVDLIAQLEANGSTPSHIITDPLGWAEVQKLKTGADYNSSLLGAGTTDAPRMLLSLPVVVNRYATPYSGVVVDKTAVASAVGQVRVATSEHALFSSDSVQLRATWRIGWNVVRPERVGTFTIGAPGS